MTNIRSTPDGSRAAPGSSPSPPSSPSASPARSPSAPTSASSTLRPTATSATSTAGDLTTPTPRSSTSTSTSRTTTAPDRRTTAAGVQEFTVDAAGTVAVAATDTGIRLDSVSPAAGWTWSAQPDQPDPADRDVHQRHPHPRVRRHAEPRRHRRRCRQRAHRHGRTARQRRRQLRATTTSTKVAGTTTDRPARPPTLARHPSHDTPSERQGHFDERQLDDDCTPATKRPPMPTPLRRAKVEALQQRRAGADRRNSLPRRPLPAIARPVARALRRARRSQPPPSA